MTEFRSLRLPVAMLIMVCAFLPASVVAQSAQTSPGAGGGAASPGPADPRLLQLLERIDQLEREVRQLRGEVEVATHEIKGVRERQRELYLDVDRRLRDVELNAVRGPATPAPVATPEDNGEPAGQSQAAAPAGNAVASAPSTEEREAYQAAFNLLKEGRYPQAVSAFQSFLSSYPNSGYADNAQYWLGEANYVSRNFKAAIEEFRKVVDGHPASPKVPDALLKLGFTEYELSQWAAARTTLQEVIQRYPKSTAARLAETRLQRMRAEGH